MRPSIALLHPYWDFWESAVPFALREDRARLTVRACRELADVAEVVVGSQVAEAADVARLAAEAAEVDAVVVLHSMAAPPEHTHRIISALPRTPVVLWAVHQAAALDAGFSHTDITVGGATVGAPMLANVLVRERRPFDLVMSPLDDTAQVRAAVRRAGAAGVVRRARVARVGAPVPGYTCVDADETALARLGPTVVRIEPAELAARAAAAPVDEVAAAREEITRRFQVRDDVDPHALERALRVEVALRRLCAEQRLAAGALNCHVPELRFGDAVGVAPCLALGRLTTDGVPWTCAGDLVTAVAMLTVKALGRPALYHEVEAVDYARDEVVLANTGEFDAGLFGGRRPPLAPDVWYTPDPLTAPCPVASPPAGPAALVGFTQLDDGAHRYVVADGHFTDARFPQTGTVNAGFRFAAGSVVRCWPAWARAGVNHHAAATDAHLGADVTVVAHHLRADCVAI